MLNMTVAATQSSPNVADRIAYADCAGLAARGERLMVCVWVLAVGSVLANPRRIHSIRMRFVASADWRFMCFRLRRPSAAGG
jgi:hypothetical protein